jgi:hypothetical protein
MMGKIGDCQSAALRHPRPGPTGGSGVHRRVQHRTPALHQRHAQPAGLRTRPRRGTRSGHTAAPTGPERGMNPANRRRLRRHCPHQTAPREATGPLLQPQGSLRDRCATGLRPAPDPGASVAPHAQRHRQDQRPCRQSARRSALRRKIPTTQVSTVLEGLPLRVAETALAHLPVALSLGDPKLTRTKLPLNES